MCEHDDELFHVELLQIRAKPGELSLADRRARIGHVVQHDEVDSLVVEGVVELAEKLLVRLSRVERSVMFACHKTEVLHLEPADDLLELGHSFPTLVVVIRGMRGTKERQPRGELR
jgi:hypothetical protein